MRRKLGSILGVVFILVLGIVIGLASHGQGDLYPHARDFAAANAPVEDKESFGEFIGLQEERDALVVRVAELNASIEQFNVQADEGKLQLAKSAERLSSAEIRVEDLEDLLKRRDESFEAELEQVFLDFKAGEAKIALLEALLDKQNEKLTALTEEREQLLQDKTDLNVRAADLLRQIEFMQQESMRRERGSPEGKEVAVLSSSLAQLAANHKGSTNKVVPICFTPSDVEPCSGKLVGELNSVMAEVQAWYRHYAGKTFEWDLAVTMQGEQSRLWYYDPNPGSPIVYVPYSGGLYSRILGEIASREKVSQDTVYAVFFQGELPTLGVGERSRFMSFSIFGDRFTDYLIAEGPGGRRLAVGTVAHELGHVLGLQHSAAPGTIMWWVAGGENILGGFSEEELRILQVSPFLR